MTFDLQKFRKEILKMDESRDYTYDSFGNFWCVPLKLEPCDPHTKIYKGITRSAKEWNKLAFGDFAE